MVSLWFSVGEVLNLKVKMQAYLCNFNVTPPSLPRSRPFGLLLFRKTAYTVGYLVVLTGRSVGASSHARGRNGEQRGHAFVPRAGFVLAIPVF